MELLDREGECAAVDALLTQARAGRSGALVLRGDPGIGKSSLLRWAVERAGDVLVLQARGFESESEIAFAGLADLLRPVLGHLGALPAPQSAALAGALAVGPPVRADRFTVCAATLSLLAAAAEAQPLLVLVDDAHWLDSSSLEAVLFAARRLGAEGVVVLLATRDPAPPGLAASGLPEVVLRGLARAAARELGRRSGTTLAPDVFDRLYDATAGNPLGLLEIPALLGEEPDAVVPAVPLPPGAHLERALRRQVDRLPGETRAALLVAAAGDDADLGLVAAALARRGLDLGALSPAEERRVVRVHGDRVLFRHPLLRGVVYHDAPVGERAAAHRALAAALAERGDGAQAADLRAWHLATAAVGYDEEAAAALEQAGTRAYRRGGYATAAHASERAAGLSPPGPDRGRRLLKAAKWWQLAGRVRRAGRLLAAALPDVADDPVRRAEVQHLRGFVQMWRQAPPPAQVLLQAEAERVVHLDPGRAALMHADAAVPCFMTGDVVQATAAARRAHDLAVGVGGTPLLVATVVLAVAEATSGHRHRARALLLEADEALRAARPLVRAQEVVLAAMAWGWLEEPERARALVDRLLREARAAGALGVLPYALALVGDLDFRTGRWDSAYACAEESVRLADETRQANSYGLFFLARMEAVLGLERACTEHVERALDVADRYGIGCMPTYTGSALGLLHLGAGRTAQAVEELRRVRALADAQGLAEAAVVPYVPDLVEALARAGDRDGARAELGAAERVAGGDGERGAWLAGALARCRGLLDAGAGAEAHFAEALAHHERAGSPFDRARSLLCQGERRRRARQRAEARAVLGEALGLFEALGARPWAERARTELAATGLVPAAPGTGALGLLTPQELQIALAVSAGASNQEAAAALFLSRKTVEHHLSAVYRKTGVASRRGLGAWLARQQG
ncbi:ATP-binding protein [Vallicoccus soli]|uniref:ATP-binding protein n=1 Tax=Vallicoccus soli TaxID=2339232 RepID=UPI00140288F3|nr:LuxR family transcriptional regulator [Vallicoccus soli]